MHTSSPRPKRRNLPPPARPKADEPPYPLNISYEYPVMDLADEDYWTLVEHFSFDIDYDIDLVYLYDPHNVFTFEQSIPAKSS